MKITPSTGADLSAVTGTLGVANGGTGRATSTTAYGLLAAGTTATGAHQTVALGATTEVLVGGGAGVLPVWTTATGSGAPVRAGSPALTTPNIGIATATSVNKVVVTAPATASTLTIADGKTLTATASITIAGTDGTTMTHPAASDTLAGLGTVETFTAAQRGAVTALTSSGASIAINLATTNNFSHTLTENTTLAAPSNPVAGQSGTIVFTQHASSPKTLAYNAFWKFAGGTVPTLTATNSAVDTFAYYVESATRATCQLIKGVA